MVKHKRICRKEEERREKKSRERREGERNMERKERGKLKVRER